MLPGSATKSWDNQDAIREPVYMQDSNDASEEILVGLQRQQLQQSNVNQDTIMRDRADLYPDYLLVTGFQLGLFLFFQLIGIF